MKYLTAESVTLGHPDKLCDFIADSILDECLKQDPDSRVACEVMLAHDTLVLAGEITTKAAVDYKNVAYGSIRYAGYELPKNFVCSIVEQSPDISQAVDKADEQGAGDQGIMYGYATNESLDEIPLPAALAHRLTQRITNTKGIGPDGKAQVTVAYDDKGRLDHVESILVSVQHPEDMTLEEVREIVTTKIINPVIDDFAGNVKLIINPSGRFVRGGFEADTGLTGRKLMVDTYGGLARHGGGALSGKDPSKVDRSGAYMARYVAKTIVDAELADRCEVSIAYAIGQAQPTMVEVDTFGTGKLPDSVLAEAIKQTFDFTPKGIAETLDLKTFIYKWAAAFGHFGHYKPYPWERTEEAVEKLKKGSSWRCRMKLRVVELFTGIGAPAAALDSIGADWESVGMVEVDPYCVTAYNAIHGTDYKPSDITKIERLPDCDMVVYGFPCTDISNAGRQLGLAEGSGTRSSLLWEVHRLLKAYKTSGGNLPKYLLMENVKALVGKKFKPYFDEWLKRLEELGYTTYWKVLNATGFGVPQNRERVFAFSILNDTEGYEFPEPTPLTVRLKDVLENGHPAGAARGDSLVRSPVTTVRRNIMANCTHDCSTCSSSCDSRSKTSFIKPPHAGAKIRHVIAVTSGKGGVGKSLVTSLLAVRARAMGQTVAILDADITGPSIPKAFGIHELATGTDGNIEPVVTRSGIKMISMNNLLEHEDDPVVWRGSLIASATLQFWTDVVWDDVDIMFIDMPPGTGDVPLSVFQSIPLSGAVVVTTPQDLVEMIVKKNVNMANLMHVPVVGLAENMSYFACPDCGKKHEIFGKSKAKELAKKYGIPAIARIPIDPAIARLADMGKLEEANTDFLAEVYAEIIKSREIKEYLN